MRKAPEAFRTISEAAELLDTPAHVLRFWESRFPQIKPVKRAGGRRYYRPIDIDLLSGIRLLLHEQGMTIRGVQKLLQEKGPRHVAELAPLSDRIAGELIEGDGLQDLAPLEAENVADDLAELDLVPPAPPRAPDPVPAVQARPTPPLPAEGPPNAFADMGTTPAPARPALRPHAPLEASRLAHQLRLGARLRDARQAGALLERLEKLAERLQQAEARDRARL